LPAAASDFYRSPLEQQEVVHGPDGKPYNREGRRARVLVDQPGLRCVSERVSRLREGTRRPLRFEVLAGEAIRTWGRVGKALRIAYRYQQHHAEAFHCTDSGLQLEKTILRRTDMTDRSTFYIPTENGFREVTPEMAKWPHIEAALQR